MNIETERLIIRSIRPGDEKAYAEMAGDGSLTEIGFDEKFDTPVTHIPEEYDFPDKLYQDHWKKQRLSGSFPRRTGKRNVPSSWRHNPVMLGLFLFTEVRDSN